MKILYNFLKNFPIHEKKCNKTEQTIPGARVQPGTSRCIGFLT